MLKDAFDDIGSKILDVSLEGLTDEDRQIIREKLSGHCQELLRAWNRFQEIVQNDPE